MLSRVADSLYWMSRNLERAEHTSRVLDVSLQAMLDYAPEMANDHWLQLLRSLGADPADFPDSLQPYSVTRALTFNADSNHSILNAIQSARENARQVRQQISSDMWEQLNRLYHRLRSVTIDDLWNGSSNAFFAEMKQGVHLFQGITDSTLTHGEGWHFIQIGRYLQRAKSTAILLESWFLDAHSAVPAGRAGDASEYVEWAGLLKSCTAFEAYCKVYTTGIRPEPIAEFLLLNPEFPHSVAFCATAIRQSLDAISDLADVPKNARVNRLAGKLCATLDFSNISEILTGGLHRSLADIRVQCGEIHSAIAQRYIAYPIEAALAS